MKKDCSVLVCGASVAGLSVAYWLTHHGFRVTVVERAPGIRPGGQALDVRGPALRVAERMGIMPSIRGHSTGLRGMSVVDSEGNELYRSTERTLTGGRLDSPDVEILRDELCNILHQAVGDGVEYLFDESIVSLSQDEHGVDVEFVGATPRRFDLVVGADGLHSGVRLLAFGPEERFIHHLGGYIASFGMANYLGLERWETFYQYESIFGGVLGLRKDAKARAYIAFNTDELLNYDYRDIVAQKRLIADWATGMGWEFPRILEHMWSASDFHFDSMSQIQMDSWSCGRVVLVGDAGYSVSPSTGQGTTVAMAGAYILAGELAAHRRDVPAGLVRYEDVLRDYVSRNQGFARSRWLDLLAETSGDDAVTYPDGIPDFGQMVQELSPRNY